MGNEAGKEGFMDIKEMARKRRGRPLSFDRERLLQSVMNKFWEDGYTAVSFNEIAKENGLTRASLYNSFESKEALFLEALEYYLQEAPDMVFDRIEAGDSVGQGFFKLFDEACILRAADLKQRGCMIVNSLNELATSPSPIGDRILTMFNQRKNKVSELITQAVEQNELPADTNIAVQANLVMTFICGFSTFSKTGVTESHLRQVCEAFLNQIGFQRPAINPNQDLGH